jgi:antitoxin CptB
MASRRTDRLRWMCRRGMQELDILLEAFLQREEAALSSGAWPGLESFLAEEDDRLWDWVQRHSEPDSAEFRELVDALHERT